MSDPNHPVRKRLAAVEAIVSTLSGAGAPWSDVPIDVLRELVETTATTSTAMTRLRTYLASNPGVATGTDPHMPRLAQRLLAAAIAAGIEPITLPRCQACHAPRPLTQTMPDGRRVCARCTNEQYIRRCHDCGRDRRVAAVHEGRDYCNMCWRRRPEGRRVCAYCGRLSIIERRTESGPQCARCAPGTVRECAGCAQLTRITGYLLGGPRCERCYNAIRKHPRTCPACSTLRILAFTRPGDATPVCSTCADVPPRFACKRCGAETLLHGRNCYTCVAKERVDELFATPHGATPAHLMPLKNAVANAGRDRSIALWARRSRSAQIIKELVDGALQLSHDALDAQRSRQAAELVRALLVETGLLPARDENAARYTRWARTRVIQGAAEHANTITVYARWQVAHDLRQPSRRPVDDSQVVGRAKAKVTVAERFLQHINGCGTTLLDARQGVLDQYLVTNPRHHVPLAPFITWARSTGRARYLTPPKLGSSLPSTIMPETQYHQLLKRLKEDDTLDSRTRLTALLVGLYAQRVSVVAAIPTTAISGTPEATRITLGESPIELPRVVGDLVRRQADQREAWNLRGPWLFPSPLPGRHISPSTLSAELNRNGIHAVPLRGASLLNLASQMPIKPISDLTGVSPQAANRWAQIAARSWNSYPTMRIPLVTGPRT